MSEHAIRGLELGRLREYLGRADVERALPRPIAGPLSGELVAGGMSNLTYSVTDGAGE